MDQSCLQIIDIEDDSEISLKDVHSNCEGSMASVYHCIETASTNQSSTIIENFENIQTEWDDFRFQINDDIQNIKRELYKLTKSFTRVYGKRF